MYKTGLLINISSIQNYVFGSNRLKENIGASHIIEHDLFSICIPKDSVGKKVYIGGGNALFKFLSDENAKSFLSLFSSNVLIHFPGISISAAIGEYNDDELMFGPCRKILAEQLVKNKAYYPSNNMLPKEGIFIDCPQTNEYQEINFEDVGWISNVSRVKFEACKRAQKNINNSLSNEKYVFTDEIEKLGQQKDKGYIAIVHIDGNNIGQQFINATSEDKLVELSNEIKEYGHAAMDALIKYFIDQLKVTKLNEEFKLERLGEKQILPIRPILTGGDDITFVCEGRLGIYLAEKFISFFENIANENKEKSETRVTACAGVAIVKTKFPFFKAYKLAEELCHEAKVSSRTDGDSWISFHVSAQGVSGNLDRIRQTALTCANGVLTGNPYRLKGNESYSLEHLKFIAHKLRANWPMSKIMELREVIKQTKSSQQLFTKEMKFRNRELPDEDLWQNEKTKYWDAMQILDFYPQTFLN